MNLKIRLRPHFLLLWLLVGCGSGGKREPAIGEAFVSPATLTLRQELGPRSAAVGTVTHGERLEILRTRRRFVKVRTTKGIEGWTDSHLLLSPEQMAEIRRFAQRSSNLPSQGKATVYSTLNVHIQPNRQSAWFMQVKEKELVNVLARRLAPESPRNPPRRWCCLRRSRPAGKRRPSRLPRFLRRKLPSRPSRLTTGWSYRRALHRRQSPSRNRPNPNLYRWTTGA